MWKLLKKKKKKQRKREKRKKANFIETENTLVVAND